MGLTLKFAIELALMSQSTLYGRDSHSIFCFVSFVFLKLFNNIIMCNFKEKKIKNSMFIF